MAVAAVLVSLARRTAGRPPLWRSKVAFVGACICLAVATALIIFDPMAVIETPILFVVAYCLFEGSMALISLRAARGHAAPAWLL